MERSALQYARSAVLDCAARRLAAEQAQAAVPFDTLAIFTCMLRMFDLAGKVDSSEDERAISLQLDAVQRAQAQQSELILKLEARISEVLAQSSQHTVSGLPRQAQSA